jgi:predicted ATPase
VTANELYLIAQTTSAVIKAIKIRNFKSVQDLQLPLSRFNVLIGSNGSGKSNILEAIAFGSAAVSDKLDSEFLSSRGIRTSDSRLMKSAFSPGSIKKPIEFSYELDDFEFNFTIEEEDKPILKWNVPERKETLSEDLSKKWKHLNSEIRRLRELMENTNENVERTTELDEKIKALIDLANKASNLYILGSKNENLSNYIIYSPEIASLRKFEEESQIQPLGIKGEGIFSLLQIFYENYGVETIKELKDYLQIIEWFEDFEAILDRTSGRKSLVVKDKFLPDVSLNQNNVNEGFLYLLFYISLFISKETPTFFAIDNIESSFHPKLCEELIKQLVSLSKKYNKQVILTTHNPFVLDGLQLEDPDQSLFVVRRNTDGETIANKINSQPKNVKLSEAWTLGYIGGQPETIE